MIASCAQPGKEGEAAHNVFRRRVEGKECDPPASGMSVWFYVMDLRFFASSYDDASASFFKSAKVAPGVKALQTDCRSS